MDGEVAAAALFPRIGEPQADEYAVSDEFPLFPDDRPVGKSDVQLLERSRRRSPFHEKAGRFLGEVFAEAGNEPPPPRMLPVSPDRPGQDREIAVQENEVLPAGAANP